MKLHFLPKFISIFWKFKVVNANEQKKWPFYHSAVVCCQFDEAKLVQNHTVAREQFYNRITVFTCLTNLDLNYIDKGHIRGKFRPLKSDFPTNAKHFRDWVNQFFMISFVWTLKPWDRFEVAGQFLILVLSVLDMQPFFTESNLYAPLNVS